MFAFLRRFPRRETARGHLGMTFSTGQEALERFNDFVASSSTSGAEATMRANLRGSCNKLADPNGSCVVQYRIRRRPLPEAIGFTRNVRRLAQEGARIDTANMPNMSI